METSRTLTRKQAEIIIKGTFPNYRGRKIRLQLTNQVTFSDLHWDGGSRNTYAAMSNDGRTDRLDCSHIAPWNNPVNGRTFDLMPGILIVEHSIFCGKDGGLTIFMNPASAGTLTFN